MTTLITGAAGFIGYHCARALLDRGEDVIGIDNLNTYYDPALKRARLQQLRHANFRFHHADIADRDAILALASPAITHVLHLAAQAGVRYSMIDPYAYVQSNVMGQVVIAELCRRLPNLRHFTYASSSSVYGLNTTLPFRETDRVDQPSSLYAATKRAAELIAHAYTHLYALPQTGLRFFTVYGPWGRPDMAYYSFAKAIQRGEPITLYEGGRLKRDFTYIDDITAGTLAALANPPPPGPPRLLNIGNNRAEPVSQLVSLLEQTLGRRAIIRSAPRPQADVEATWADIETIQTLAGLTPSTTLETGIPRFVEWFRAYEK